MFSKKGTKNYFEIFSFATDFAIDEEGLETKYIEFQKQFHPDSLIGKKDNDSLGSINDSILINQAYQTLKNPIKRAIYLLKLQEIDIEAEDSQLKPDQQILSDILELREKIANEKNLQAKDQIKKTIAAEIKILINEFKNEFDKSNYQMAAQKLIKVKYLDKILTDLKSGK